MKQPNGESWFSWPRSGLALCIILSCVEIAQRPYLPDYADYDPKGITALLLPSRPPQWLAYGFLLACGIFAVAMIRHRLFSLPAAFFIWICAALAQAHLPGHWSHGFTFVALVSVCYGIAVTFLPARNREFVAAWVGWTALSLCFLNAFYFKAMLGPEWALSENMRYQLILQYPILGRPMPFYLQYLADRPWCYQGLAIGNIVAQFAIGISPLFFFWTWGRRAATVLFMLEVFALWMVMSIDAKQWYPLAIMAVGVGLTSEFKPREASTEQDSPGRGYYLQSGFAIAAASILIVGQLFTGFVLPKGGHFKWNWYPLTQYLMYSVVYRTDENIGGVRFIAPHVTPEAGAESEVTEHQLNELNTLIMLRWTHVVSANTVEVAEKYNEELKDLCVEKFGKRLLVEISFAEGTALAPPAPASVEWRVVKPLIEHVRGDSNLDP